MLQALLVRLCNWSDDGFRKIARGVVRRFRPVLWAREIFSLPGVAHLFSAACLVIQSIAMDLFLWKYLSADVLVTLLAEIPLLLHMAWYWKQETAANGTPTQWLVYSWVHGAKVLVLYCKVMPRLPTPTTEIFSVTAGIDYRAYIDEFYSSTVLANLLLITPMFYTLLMFRTGMSIFGKSIHRISADLIMHYDMLWHVVIDMVDMVDMFQYARLPEWIGDGIVQTQSEGLVLIQNIVPFWLFLAIVLHGQSLPGVVVDEFHFLGPEDRERIRDKDTAPTTAPASGRTSSEISRGSTGRSIDGNSENSVDFPGATSSLTDRKASGGKDFMEDHGSSHEDQEAARNQPPLTTLRRPPSIVVEAKSTVARRTSSVRDVQQRGARHHHRQKHRQEIKEISNRIQRHTVITARNRSAIVSIFFVDMPFLFVRVFLWFVTWRAGSPQWGNLAGKNVVCMMLNVLQYSFGRYASGKEEADIKYQLQKYRRAHPRGPARSTEGASISADAPSSQTADKRFNAHRGAGGVCRHFLAFALSFLVGVALTQVFEIERIQRLFDAWVPVVVSDLR